MKKYSLSMEISFAFLIVLLIGCSSQKKTTQQIDFRPSIENPIEGQVHTAKRLKVLMDEKKYEQAINLFSKEQQLNIREIQKDKEIFKYWCLAWTMDELKYERYIARIKKGKGDFVFEDDEWKIDEK